MCKLIPEYFQRVLMLWSQDRLLHPLIQIVYDQQWIFEILKDDDYIILKKIMQLLE